jgi:selenocysteine lyase/cysteine desulfurase
MNAPTPTATLGDRSLFSSLSVRAYLAHAAISPPSQPVLDAVHATLLGYATRGALSFGATVAQRVRLRTSLETLIHAEPGAVAIVPNTSAGVTHVALSRPWRRGDKVLLFEGEFPANTTPWQRAAALHGLVPIWQRADRFRSDATRAFEALDDALRAGVCLVAFCQVQFQTGHRMPLAEIARRAHAHGAEVFVDAIQGVGAVPIDVQRDGVDYLSAGSHKWLMGPEGAGVLYVRPALAKRMAPYTAGWLSHEDPIRFLVEGAGHLRYDRPLRTGADVFEGGTFAATTCAGLEASLQLIAQPGVDAVYAHVNHYLDVLEAGLMARGFRSLRSRLADERSCILGVHMPEGARYDVPTFARRLGERAVVVSTPDGVLRFAPHWPNHVREVAEVLDAIDDALR